jgi:hypothetical protein
MKITLDLPEIEGYEYTGEFRRAKDREPYMTSGGGVESCIGGSNSQYPILKKKAPKYETRFIDKQNCLWIGDDQGIREGKTYVEIKAISDLVRLAQTNIEDMDHFEQQEWAEIKELLN